MTQMLTERYRDRMVGVLSCYDRIVISGTLPGACYAAGTRSFLNAKGIRIFDCVRFAEPLRERIRAAAQLACEKADIGVEHINKPHLRKEDVVAKVLARRGDHHGLVHVISAMEACESYRPWHDKASGKIYLRPDSGKCLHYYFYFIDESFGLCYLRVPTWCPFRLQFYCNGHSWLARKLGCAGIDFTVADNAFVQVADIERAELREILAACNRRYLELLPPHAPGTRSHRRGLFPHPVPDHPRSGQRTVRNSSPKSSTLE